LIQLFKNSWGENHVCPYFVTVSISISIHLFLVSKLNSEITSVAVVRTEREARQLSVPKINHISLYPFITLWGGGERERENCMCLNFNLY
jgi:hypothetical protein